MKWVLPAERTPERPPNKGAAHSTDVRGGNRVKLPSAPKTMEPNPGKGEQVEGISGKRNGQWVNTCHIR